MDKTGFHTDNTGFHIENAVSDQDLQLILQLSDTSNSIGRLKDFLKL